MDEPNLLDCCQYPLDQLVRFLVVRKVERRDDRLDRATCPSPLIFRRAQQGKFVKARY